MLCHTRHIEYAILTFSTLFQFIHVDKQLSSSFNHVNITVALFRQAVFVTPNLIHFCSLNSTKKHEIMIFTDLIQTK